MPIKVVSLEEFKLARSPHVSGAAFCLDCKHEWAAVAPSGATWLECPKCSLVRGRMKFPCDRPGHVWNCGCGNELFLIVPEGVLCPNCGSFQFGY